MTTQSVMSEIRGAFEKTETRYANELESSRRSQNTYIQQQAYVAGGVCNMLKSVQARGIADWPLGYNCVQRPLCNEIRQIVPRLTDSLRILEIDHFASPEIRIRTRALQTLQKEANKRSPLPLNNDRKKELRRLAPAVFATLQHTTGSRAHKAVPIKELRRRAPGLFATLQHTQNEPEAEGPNYWPYVVAAGLGFTVGCVAYDRFNR